MKNHSASDTLYGAKGYSQVSNNGCFIAFQWAEVRAAGRNWGNFDDIVWFEEPSARDEFIQLFGGVSVTITRVRKEKRLSGTAALDFLKNARGNA